MYKIVINTAIDKQKSLRMSKAIELDEISNSILAIERDGPEARLNNDQLGKVIEQITSALPEKQRLVFILRDLQGMDPHEVENVLDLTETSVKSNLYHARQVVRLKLEKFLETERRA